MSHFFKTKIDELKTFGVESIILDPGFGFGKTLEHNYTLLKNLSQFQTEFNLPVLVGLSRKSMINKVIGTKPEDALNGTTALHMIALLNGAHILRVHDVKEAYQTIQLFEQYKQVLH
jgi:dihydropteroate synthase